MSELYNRPHRSSRELNTTRSEFRLRVWKIWKEDKCNPGEETGYGSGKGALALYYKESLYIGRNGFVGRHTKYLVA